MKTINCDNNSNMKNWREKASQVLTQSQIVVGERYCI